jgi:nucleotide-binding universal stress UspA family protein
MNGEGREPGDENEAARAAGAEGGGWQVRRIFVALDASPASAAAAQTAADLAARLHAELRGLYVEDADLLRLAGLPSVETGTFSARARRLEEGDLERQLRAQADRARRLLDECSVRAGLASHHFEVLRGDVRRAVAEVAEAGDLLSLGRVGTTRLHRLGSVARAALAQGRGQILLLAESGRFEPPVVVVNGHTRGDHRALHAALRMAERRFPDGRRREDRLTLLLAAGAEDAGILEREARHELAAAGHDPDRARFHRVRPGDHHALARAVARDRANALILPHASPLVRAGDLEEVVANLDCTVLLVR